LRETKGIGKVEEGAEQDLHVHIYNLRDMQRGSAGGTLSST
jgi:hypothetical protein